MFRPFFALFVVLAPLVVLGQGDAPPVRTFQPHAAPTPQAVDTPFTNGPGQGAAVGRVDVVMDPRIERAMGQYAERKHTQQGYRVQVFLGDRRTAEETKRAFLLKYTDMPVYMSWLAPNFRLRVGDLRTRVEAERLLRDLKAAYPGSYIVRDEIEPPAMPGSE
jgi:hypothetical protein